MSKFDKTYSNGEITIFWKPDMCIHSAKCFHSLPEVFNPSVKPWIQPEKSTTENIMTVINRCPSGAISYKISGETEIKEIKPLEDSSVKIEVKHNGPLTISGKCVIINTDGTETIKEGRFSLCRCGLSNKKPFCDGSHKTLTHDL
ncbi:MAG: (4Fe-4S)-binding protein [Ignavibacteria bacterium]|nr:(4Fe-4S)-binding protein [Ignavibacteria bacterium]